MSSVRYYLVCFAFCLDSISFAFCAQTENLEQILQIEARKVQAKNYERLKKRTVIGIELITADSMQDGPIYSSFGHLLLRFVDDDPDPTNDVVLSFLALTPLTQAPDIVKGISGGYRIQANLMPMRDIFKQYVLTERRSLSRLIIPTTLEQRTRLLNQLLEWVSVGTADRYSFLNLNCARIMIEYLQNAEIVTELSTRPVMIPAEQIPRIVNRYPIIRIPKPLKTLRLSNVDDINNVDEANWAYWFDSTLSENEKNDLKKRYRIKSFMNLTRMASAPSFMYRVVKDEIEAEVIFKYIWDRSADDQKAHIMRRLTQELDSNLKNVDLRIHWTLLKLIAERQDLNRIK